MRLTNGALYFRHKPVRKEPRAALNQIAVPGGGPAMARQPAAAIRAKGAGHAKGVRPARPMARAIPCRPATARNFPALTV